MKPCPFCGKPARLCGGNYDPEYWYVSCLNIECGATTFGAKTPDEAIEKWERRAYESTSNTAES